nr:hypothetical protein [Zygogramma bicolorata]
MEAFGSYIIQTQEVMDIKSFNSKNRIADLSTDLNELFDAFRDSIIAQASEFEGRDSGWSCEKVLFLEVNINRHTPFGGSSYIKLPLFIERKMAVVNVKNYDQHCFAWAITSALFPANDNTSLVSSYPHFSTVLNLTDATNLYGHSMSQPLPTHDFKWLTPEEISNLDLMGVGDNDSYGYVLEVDIHYPQELHDHHADLPFLVERMIPPNSKCKIPKLIPNLRDKQKYIVHYKNLKQAINNGLIVVHTHRVLRFKQSCWMKPYIDLNTQMRNSSTNKSEKDFYKLMVNSVYGIGYKLSSDGQYDMQGKRLKNAGKPIDESDCVTRSYIDEKIEETKALTLTALQAAIKATIGNVSRDARQAFDDKIAESRVILTRKYNNLKGNVDKISAATATMSQKYDGLEGRVVTLEKKHPERWDESSDRLRMLIPSIAIEK